MRVASSGMAWKGIDTGEVIAVAGGDIKTAQWLRVARGFQLRIGLKDRKRETFDGFKREVRARYGSHWPSLNYQFRRT
jgi:structure-specific recognition protein 1